MSSSYYNYLHADYPASNSVNGASYPTLAFSHTGGAESATSDTKPFFTVDLGSTFNLAAVQVVNRRGCTTCMRDHLRASPALCLRRDAVTNVLSCQPTPLPAAPGRQDSPEVSSRLGHFLVYAGTSRGPPQGFYSSSTITGVNAVCYNSGLDSSCVVTPFHALPRSDSISVSGGCCVTVPT